MRSARGAGGGARPRPPKLTPAALARLSALKGGIGASAGPVVPRTAPRTPEQNLQVGRAQADVGTAWSPEDLAAAKRYGAKQRATNKALESMVNPLKLWGAAAKSLAPTSLVKLSRGQTPSAEDVGLDVASFLPVSRLARGAAEAVRAAAVAEQGARAARAAEAGTRSFRAGKGVVGGLAGAAKKYAPRTLKFNGLEAQLPKARSPITNLGERAADRASQALQGSELAKKTPGLRMATAAERVAKAAGRAQRLERARADAGLAEHLHVLAKVKPGSPEDVAHFWYAQLPEKYRNAGGLALIRAKQSDELSYITSGKALEDLTKHEGAVRTQLAKLRGAGLGTYERVGAKLDNPEQATQALKLLRDLEDLKVLKSDLPQRTQDIAASMAHLEGLIRNAPAADEKVIEAVHALSADRQRILQEGGKLNPEKAAERQGIVSRWLGLEPTGEEAFIGHRLPRPESFSGSFLPSGGVGRVKTPQGVAKANKLVLARTGRVRQSVHVAAEDRAAAQAFEQGIRARSDLGAMGEPFKGHVPSGHVLVNPRGRTIPPNWRAEDFAQLGDSYSSTDEIRQMAKDMLDGFIAEDPAAIERLKTDALAQGVKWDELRTVPKRLVDRYYSQFRSLKRSGAAGKAYDAAVDAAVTSIVFGRIGYIPKNLVQNVIMALPHQGAFLLPNAVHAAQAMRDPQLRRLIGAEVGFTGATGALGREAVNKRIVGRVAGAVSRIADDPLRVTAFLQEASAEGVIPKVGLLSDRDRAALVRLLTDKSQRPLLNDIRSRAVEAMADFSRLTPDQAHAARRLLIIPGWLAAGSRYPFHFAATHPIRSALLAYAAMGEPGAPDAVQFNRPADQWFHGAQATYGIDTPWGRLRTNSLSPVNTPWDLLQAGVQTAEGKSNPFAREDTAFSYAQPLLAAGVKLAQGEGVEKSLLPLAPNVKLAMQLASPEATATYPGDASRLGRLERELGVIPIPVAPEGKEATYIAKSTAAGLGAPPPGVLEDLKWREKLGAKLKRDQTWGERARTAVELYDERYSTDFTESVLPLIKTEGQAYHLYEQITGRLYPTYSQWDAQLSKLEEQRVMAQEESGAVPASKLPPMPPEPVAPAANPHAAPAPAPPQRGSTPSTASQPVAEPASYQLARENATLASASTGLAALASGTYSPVAQLGELLDQLASEPLAKTAKMQTGEKIHFQISGPVTKAAHGAVALAQAYLGTPYVSGGESPSGFDCSGLLQFIYAKAGVTIPRTTYDQWQTGTSIPKGQLQPGDAVFFTGSDPKNGLPGHVGIYIGQGRFIEAPGTGSVVRVSKLAGRTDYVGARRYSAAGSNAA